MGDQEVNPNYAQYFIFNDVSWNDSITTQIKNNIIIKISLKQLVPFINLNGVMRKPNISEICNVLIQSDNENTF